MPGGARPAAVISRGERQLRAAADCVTSRLPPPGATSSLAPLPGGVTVPRSLRGRHRCLAVLATDVEYFGKCSSARAATAEYSRLTLGLPRHGTCEQMPLFCAAA